MFWNVLLYICLGLLSESVAVLYFRFTILRRSAAATIVSIFADLIGFFVIMEYIVSRNKVLIGTYIIGRGIGTYIGTRINLTAGENITLSAATSGSYALYSYGTTTDPNAPKNNEEGATFMVNYTKGDETSISISAYYKDALYATDGTSYFGLFESSGTTAIQWTRTIIGTCKASLSVPFPHNATTVAVSVTAAGGTPTGTVVIGLKRDNARG